MEGVSFYFMLLTQLSKQLLKVRLKTLKNGRASNATLMSRQPQDEELFKRRPSLVSTLCDP